jgi:predicted ester cyclase
MGRDSECVKEWIKQVRTAYPDMQWQADDIFASGGKVTLLWSWTGTNTGPLPAPPGGEALPATGKSVSNSGFAVLHTVDGMMTESWGYFDMAALQLQLGYTITPPEPAA